MALLTIYTHSGDKHSIAVKPDSEIPAMPDKGWITFGNQEKQVCLHAGHIASVTLERD